MSFCVNVFKTTSHKKEALNFVIFGPVSSLIWWEEKIDEASDFLVVIKSRRDLFKRLCEKVKEIHSYEGLEILELPIAEGLPSYRVDERLPSW